MVFFSTAITEEKEEETLPLLKLAGIDTLALLLGKSTVRALRVILLLMSQLPFLMLAIALGGITSQQIYATIMAMVAYVILIANFSLLCSVYAKRSGEATALVVGGLFVLFISPLLLITISSDLQFRGYLATHDFLSRSIDSYSAFFQKISVINSINSILNTGDSELVLSTQVVSNTLIGGCCFIIAWLIFERCTEINSASRSRNNSEANRQKKKMSRPGRLAISWKEFHFSTGGIKALIIKSILYLSGIFLVLEGRFLFDSYFNSSLFPYSRKELISTAFFLMLCALVIECTIYFSRSFREERKQKTLPLLRILPLSLLRISYEKVWGCLIALVPVCIGICCIVFFSRNSIFTNLLYSEYQTHFYFFLIQFIVFLHLLTYFSIIVRWGALAFTIGTMILIESCATPFLHFTFLLLNKALGETGVILPVFYLGLLSCFALQLLIANRLYNVSTEQ